MKPFAKARFLSVSFLSAAALLAVPAAGAATFLIDFGGTGQTTSNDGTNQWNNLTANGDNPATLPRTGTIQLVDVANSGALGISMKFAYPTQSLSDTFEMNSNDSGFTASLSNLGLLNIPSAKRDTVWSNGDGGDPKLTFTGLDPATLYTFTIFAYRNATPARTTTYILNGSTTASTVYDVYTSVDGDGTVATLADRPDGLNELALVLDPGSGGYAYIGAMQIQTSPVPEPGPAVLATGALALLGLRRRR